MLRLSLVALLVLSGCAASRTVQPIVTTLTYVTTVPAPAALDSVRVWATSVRGLSADRLGSSSLVILDERSGSAERTTVDAVSRIDGVTQVSVRTEHVASGRPVAVAWYERVQSVPEVLVLPADGSDSGCFPVDGWRRDLARRAEPRDPADAPTEVNERQPELIGGLAALRVEYPPAMRRAGVEGKVVVRFVVDEYGSVECAESILSPHIQFSEAALVAVRRARFVPGMQRGEAVRVRFTLPVTFNLR